jgi:hypothetical protein
MNSSVTMARVYQQVMPAPLGPTVVREKTNVDVEVRIFRIMHTFLLFSWPRQACGTLSKLKRSIYSKKHILPRCNFCCFFSIKSWHCVFLWFWCCSSSDILAHVQNNFESVPQACLGHENSRKVCILFEITMKTNTYYNIAKQCSLGETPSYYV